MCDYNTAQNAHTRRKKTKNTNDGDIVTNLDSRVIHQYETTKLLILTMLLILWVQKILGRKLYVH